MTVKVQVVLDTEYGDVTFKHLPQSGKADTSKGPVFHVSENLKKRIFQVQDRFENGKEGDRTEDDWFQLWDDLERHFLGYDLTAWYQRRIEF